MIIEQKKIFYINSDNRLSGTSSNFTYKINTLPTDEFTHCAVLSAIIPKSYYAIRAGRNTFTVWIDNGFSYDEFPINIPIGNYNRRSLALTLQNCLNTQISLGVQPFSVSFTTGNSGADTGKYTFTFDNSLYNTANIYFEFTNNVYYALGFNKNSQIYFTYNIGTDKHILESTNVIDIQAFDQIFIKSDIIDDTEGNNVLQDIYSSANDPSFSNIHYELIDLQSCAKKMKDNSNNILHIWITDEQEETIELNGLNIIITLMLFRTSNIWRKLSGFLSLATLKL